MISIDKLRELVRLMVENDLSELDLKDQEQTIVIKRAAWGASVPPAWSPPPQPLAPAKGPPPAVASPPASAPAAPEAGLAAIVSPMVGTFYASPNPDAPPFVNVGSRVQPDTVVCLIEAMKVFNEIKAEVSGTIEQVLVENGEAVEYGQKLFLVRGG